MQKLIPAKDFAICKSHKHRLCCECRRSHTRYDTELFSDWQDWCQGEVIKCSDHRPSCALFVPLEPK